MADKFIVFLARGSLPELLEKLAEECEIRRWSGDEVTHRNDLFENVRGVHAMFIYPPLHVDAQLLDAAGPQLKVIGTHSVGLDHVDLAECKRRGVKVGYTPEVVNCAVAELALALTLATLRRLQEGMQAVHNGKWGTDWGNALWMTGGDISENVVGIVGLGRIGLTVAKRIKAFEPARILYCGHSPKPSADEVKAEYVSFEDLLSQSDIVIATCSVSASNHHLFNASAFSMMKPTAIFINVTRGALVDQEALFSALVSGQIASAGLDVTTPEPLPPDHPLLQLPNCTVLPHLGSATRRTRYRMCSITVENILAGLHGKPLPSPAV